MGFFFSQTYTFNTSNKKLVDLIQTYNKGVYIVGVNRKIIGGMVRGAQLRQLLTDLQVEGEVTIQCRTMSPASTIDIMPEYKDSPLAASIKKDPSDADKQMVGKARSAVNFYLEAKIPQDTRGMKYDVAYRAPEFKLQNEAQALLLLDRIYTDYKDKSPYPMRAFLVEGMDAILFQYHSDPFLSERAFFH